MATLQADARHRRAFTLYEVLMAALVLALGLLGSLALFPKALDVQKMARQRILAATVALDLTTRHAAGFDHNARPVRDEHPLLRSPNAPDLLRLGQRESGSLDRGADYWRWEGSGGSDSVSFHTSDAAQRGSTDADFGLMMQNSLRPRLFGPVPSPVLERLDSDDDEIRRLAELGIGVYYLWPAVINDDRSDGGQLVVSDQAAEPLIFAAVGFPQMNAMFHSPSMFHHEAMIDKVTSYWRRKNRFLYDADADPALEDWQVGPARWRSNHWDPWRYRLKNGYETGATGHANNGAFVFPFKYYLWDYEVHVLQPHGVEWEKYAQPEWNWYYKYGGDVIRRFDHATTAIFDQQEDTDSAFPLDNVASNSLFVPFRSRHRCRELVFWSVNWKDYEDAELAEEGGYTDIAMHPQGHSTNWSTLVANNMGGRRDYGKYIDYWVGNDWAPGTRNDGTRNGDYNPVLPYYAITDWASTDPVDDASSMHPRWLAGIYGLMPSYERWFDWHWLIDWAIFRRHDGTSGPVFYTDRNFNEVLDVGPVPRSVRLRARTVARFNVYDKRLHTTY